MLTLQLVGGLLVIGTAAIWLAAGAPTALYDSYGSSDLQTRIDTLATHRRAWVLANLGYLTGIIITGLGLVLLAIQIRATDPNPLALAGIGVIVLASLAGVVGVYLQVSLPPEKVLGTTSGRWGIRAFSLLTLGAFLIFGIVLLLAGIPAWLGIVTIVLSGSMLTLLFIWDFSIPPLYYLVTLVIGLALLLA